MYRYLRKEFVELVGPALNVGEEIPKDSQL